MPVLAELFLALDTLLFVGFVNSEVVYENVAGMSHCCLILHLFLG